MEIAIFKMHNDLTLNMDNDKITAFTLLDLSAAFDTINHATINNITYDLHCENIEFL